jgi:hypothetical protein
MKRTRLDEIISSSTSQNTNIKYEIDQIQHEESESERNKLRNSLENELEMRQDQSGENGGLGQGIGLGQGLGGQGNQNNQGGIRRKCPYLDTIDRQKLDFDMEKVCSVTLSNMNVYSCLVCGKFFQGRGQTTPGENSTFPHPSPPLVTFLLLLAFTHSVQCGHFVFLNLHTYKAYCLPDGYEV